MFFAFPIHVWSIVYELREIPSLMLSMSGGEIVGSLAYGKGRDRHRRLYL